MRRNPLLFLFAGVLGFFYAVVVVTQILGISGFYKPVLAIPLILILTGVVCFYFFRSDKSFNSSFQNRSIISKSDWLGASILFAGLSLYILLIFFPLAHWPYSPITAELPWDAGLYHFPKAVELISTGSALGPEHFLWRISLRLRIIDSPRIVPQPWRIPDRCCPCIDIVIPFPFNGIIVRALHRSSTGIGDSRD